jgi:hypothetical protein
MKDTIFDFGGSKGKDDTGISRSIRSRNSRAARPSGPAAGSYDDRGGGKNKRSCRCGARCPQDRKGDAAAAPKKIEGAQSRESIYQLSPG